MLAGRRSRPSDFPPPGQQCQVRRRSGHTLKPPAWVPLPRIVGVLDQAVMLVCMGKLLQAARPISRNWYTSLTRRAMAAVQVDGKPQADVAIIGGGVAGLTCALELASQGISCTVFDMGTRTAGKAELPLAATQPSIAEA